MQKIYQLSYISDLLKNIKYSFELLFENELKSSVDHPLNYVSFNPRFIYILNQLELNDTEAFVSFLYKKFFLLRFFLANENQKKFSRY